MPLSNLIPHTIIWQKAKEKNVPVLYKTLNTAYLLSINLKGLKYFSFDFSVSLNWLHRLNVQIVNTFIGIANDIMHYIV